jgi:hypothetical protein
MKIGVLAEWVGLFRQSILLLHGMKTGTLAEGA